MRFERRHHSRLNATAVSTRSWRGKGRPAGQRSGCSMRARRNRRTGQMGWTDSQHTWRWTASVTLLEENGCE
jgi:hypothetical protein